MRNTISFMMPIVFSLWTGILTASPVVVDEPAVCLQCHDDITDAMKKKTVHSALKSGKCSSCHNPHASNHA